MVNAKQRIFFCVVASAGMVACSQYESSVMTQTWQIKKALIERPEECRYRAIAETLSDEIRATPDGEEILTDLRRVCPDLKVAFLESRDSSSSQTSFTEPNGNEGGSFAEGGANTSNSGNSGTTSNTSGEADGSGTGDGSGSGDGGGTSDGGGTGDSDGTGDSGGKGNNGSGNGSEGNSPGRGRGANNDEP